MSETKTAFATSKTVTLKNPVRNDDGQTVSILTLREPTGKDIRTCGYPLKLLDGSYDFNEGAMSKMIGQLAGIFPPDVDKMCMADWSACATAVASFLEGMGQMSSTDTGSAPGSGGGT